MRLFLHLFSSVTVLFAEVDIFKGVADVLNSSPLPHTSKEWGAVLGYAILFVIARMAEFVVNRATILRGLSHAAKVAAIPAAEAAAAVAAAAAAAEPVTLKQ